jgi:hypothetical protein
MIKNWTNAELEEKVLELLDEKDGKPFREVCEVLGVDPSGHKDSHFREVDRALQRLRKQDKVMFGGKGWIRKTGEWVRVN